MKRWTPGDIKKLREKYKLSQKKLGELSGVSTNYIYLLEKGVRTSSKTLSLLLDYIEREFKEKEKRKRKAGEETWQIRKGLF